MSTVTMFAKFGNFFKKGRDHPAAIAAFSVAPHSPREERIIAEICEQASNKLIAATRTGESASWSPEKMDVSGIVLCATDEEVRAMIAARVVARVRHYAQTDLDGHRVSVSPSLGLLLTGDAEIASARQAAVEGMADRVREIGGEIAARIAAAVRRDGSASYDLASFSPHRSLAWPLEGWDRNSLRAAGEAVIAHVSRDLEEGGLAVRLRNGALLVTDPEPNPSI